MNPIQQSTVMGILNKVQCADDWIIFLEQLNHHFNLQASQILAIDLGVEALSFSIHHGVNFDSNQLEQAALKQIRLEIDDDLWRAAGLTVGDHVRVVGEVDTHRYKPTDIEVVKIEKIQH